MKLVQTYLNIFTIFFVLILVPVSNAVKGCTVMLQSDTSNFKVAICNDPNTNLTNIPKDLPVNTIRLDMMYQTITSLTSNDFSHIYQLEYLMINSCGIRHMETSTFENINQLRVLALSNNSLVIHDNSNLQSDLFRPLISLSVLDLSFNFIQLIPKHFFKYLDKTLRVLVISNSKSLLTITPESLSDLHRLERLDISQNNLIQLDSKFEAVFNKMISLQNLILHGNPWKCDCKMRWLVFWYQHSTLANFPSEYPNGETHSHYPPTLCHSPRSMRNALLLRPISSPIKLNEFPCFPKSLSQNRQLNINEGNNISLPCRFESLDYDYKIIWSHNGTLLKQSVQTSITQLNEKQYESVLSIINVTYRNSGFYSCYVLFDGHIIGTNFSIILKSKTNDKYIYIKGSLNMNIIKTVTLTLLGSITLIFLLSLFMGLIYRYFYHYKPRTRINNNKKYANNYSEISRDRHNMMYNRLQENKNNNLESFEFWNLRSSEIDDEALYINSTILKNPTIVTSLSTDAFTTPFPNKDTKGQDSHIFVNPYIEDPSTLIIRTPSSTPCPIHDTCVPVSMDTSKNDSLISSIYHPCPLHGDMLSILMQPSTSLS